MSINWKEAARFVRIPASAYDAIFPHGPLGLGLHHNRPAGVEVAGPHPEPWREATLGAVMVNELLSHAISASGGREGGAVIERFLLDIDDWCGTGWPHWWPKPKGPRGLDLGQVFLGAAGAAALLADSFDHNPELQEALGRGFESLNEQAMKLG